MTLHWHLASPLMRQTLRQVAQGGLGARFYLAGGTALALQVGHRLSVVLDFFSAIDEVRPQTHREILAVLQSFQPNIVEQEWGNLVLLLDDLRVGFFSYGYPLLETGIDAEGIVLASLLDIGLMKMDAIATRAMRKDFCDLYIISRIIPLRQLLDAAPRKYPNHRDFEARVVRYLTFFERADQEEAIALTPDISWEEIKTTLRQEATRLANKWWQNGDG
jgi:hypothetical protein